MSVVGKLSLFISPHRKPKGKMPERGKYSWRRWEEREVPTLSCPSPLLGFSLSAVSSLPYVHNVGGRGTGDIVRKQEGRTADGGQKVSDKFRMRTKWRIPFSLSNYLLNSTPLACRSSHSSRCTSITPRA